MPVVPESSAPRPKPLLFDQARHSYGRIWLRPQELTDRRPKPQEEGRYLKLTFRLNQNPDLAVMNELALQLQFLPHVDQIRFEDLYAPAEQITDFMRLVMLASKLRPLIRKLQARRQGREIRALAGQNQKETPLSLIELHLKNSNRPACDWSSASQVEGHIPTETHHSIDQRTKSGAGLSRQALAIPKQCQPNGRSGLENDIETADAHNRDPGIGKRSLGESPNRAYSANSLLYLLICLVLYQYFCR